jgi:hypothetical protein
VSSRQQTSYFSDPHLTTQKLYSIYRTSAIQKLRVLGQNPAEIGIHVASVHGSRMRTGIYVVAQAKHTACSFGEREELAEISWSRERGNPSLTDLYLIT